MKLQKPENENYAATVVRIKAINELPKMNSIAGALVMGQQAIVSKEHKVGDIGLHFPAEAQLSQEYASANNLYAHGNLNKDEGAKGYLGDNGRVRAIKLQGNRSDCLFMPLESLAFAKVKVSDLKEGDTFDQINGIPICKKYVVKQTAAKNRLEKNKLKQSFVRVDKKFIPEHYDTDNFFKVMERNPETIPGNTPVTITQKLHGTSIRIGNTLVARKLKLRDKIAKKLGVAVRKTDIDYVFGSRKVIKDINNPNQNHFYTTDIWTDEGKKLEGLIPENFLVYGELIGYTPTGSPIQEGYTYCVPEKTCDLYIYRVATINSTGTVVDLTWNQVKEFCHDRGLKHVPELWQGQFADFKPTEWQDTRYYDKLHGGYKNAVPLGDNQLVDEGVCLRVDGLAPYILKIKSPVFLQHETAMLDKEAVDLEAEGSEA